MGFTEDWFHEWAGGSYHRGPIANMIIGIGSFILLIIGPVFLYWCFLAFLEFLHNLFIWNGSIDVEHHYVMNAFLVIAGRAEQLWFYSSMLVIDILAYESVWFIGLLIIVIGASIYYVNKKLTGVPVAPQSTPDSED